MKSIKTIEINAIAPSQMKSVKGGSSYSFGGDRKVSPGSRPVRPTSQVIFFDF